MRYEMQDNKYILTADEFDNLRAEYDRLIHEGREEVRQKITAARQLDCPLTDNDDYALARDEQAELELRIYDLEKILNTSTDSGNCREVSAIDELKRILDTSIAGDATAAVWHNVGYGDFYTYWNQPDAELVFTFPLTGFDQLIRSDQAPAAWKIYRNACGFYKVLELKNGTQYLMSSLLRVQQDIKRMHTRDGYAHHTYRMEEEILRNTQGLEEIACLPFNPENFEEVKVGLGISYDVECCNEFLSYLENQKINDPEEAKLWESSIPSKILDHCQKEDIYGTYGRNVWFWWEKAESAFHIFGNGHIRAGLEVQGEYFNWLCIFLCGRGRVKKIIFEQGITFAEKVDVFDFPEFFFPDFTGFGYELDELVLSEGMENVPEIEGFTVGKLKVPHSVPSICPLDKFVAHIGGHYDPITYTVSHLILPSDIQLGRTFTLCEPAEYLNTIEFYGQEPVKDPEMLCEAGLFSNGAGFNATIRYPKEWDQSTGEEKGFADTVMDYLRSRRTGWRQMYWNFDRDKKTAMDAEDPAVWKEEDYQELRTKFKYAEEETPENADADIFAGFKPCMEMLQDLENEIHFFGQDFLNQVQFGLTEGGNRILNVDEYPPVILYWSDPNDPIDSYLSWFDREMKMYLTFIDQLISIYSQYQMDHNPDTKTKEAHDQSVYHIGYLKTMAQFQLLIEERKNKEEDIISFVSEHYQSIDSTCEELDVKYESEISDIPEDPAVLENHCNSETSNTINRMLGEANALLHIAENYISEDNENVIPMLRSFISTWQEGESL